mmetsp:Transcript_31126/g.48751  ORF Transcript_31126/g.48751 Transcript_31126/m.48751 type:complete len:320 (-) Transcript_31126:119-1078(-)
MDLVEVTGNSWRRKARKNMGGVGAMFQEIKDFKNKVSEGSSLLYGAFEANRMAESMNKAALAKREEVKKIQNEQAKKVESAGPQSTVIGAEEGQGAGTKAAEAEPKPAEPETKEQASNPATPAPQPQAQGEAGSPSTQTPEGAGGGAGTPSPEGKEGSSTKEPAQDEEDDDEVIGVELNPEDVRKFARHSIDLIWRTGIFLIQRRIRKVVDEMLEVGRTSVQTEGKSASEVKKLKKSKVYSLASALMELGDHFRQEWEAQKSAQGSSEPWVGGGAPLHLADDIADTVAAKQAGPAAQEEENRESEFGAEGSAGEAGAQQ